MAIGIEPHTTAEARLPLEVLFGHALQVVEEPEVGFIQLPQDIGECRVSFLFRHLRIEDINATILDVSWRLASCKNERQIL